MHQRKIIIFAGLLFFGLLALMLAESPIATVGASASGDDLCADCHEELVAGFAGTIHSRIREHEAADGVVGCAACHGPGEEHAEEEDPEKIVAFSALSVESASEACLKCHAGADKAHWLASEHALGGVGCTSCHVIHAGNDHEARYKALGSCGWCHEDVGAQMNLPSHHPVREGKMHCVSCHEPHGSAVDFQLRSSERGSDLCLSCHSAKQGPFIFEHAPVVEDCMICHAPHGSVANNLLTENEPFLCLQCHEFHFHAGARGGDATEYTLVGEVKQNPYTTFGWRMAYTKKCTQCHVMIHGSDLPSQSLTGQGKGLTR